jgi:large subunit ribosomal protein L15
MSMIHDITSAAPRNKRSQRKGRGESSGRGKTCGRGNKGSKARVGKYIKRGYEGGQTPFFRRVPKRGFSNDDFERRFHIVNLADLDRFEDGTIVDAAALIEAGLVPDDKQPVKILGEGEVSKKLTVVAGWYSRSAHQRITEAGGTAQNLRGETFEFPKPKKKFIPRDPVKKAKVADAGAEAEAKPAEAQDKAKGEKAPQKKPGEGSEQNPAEKKPEQQKPAEGAV